MGRFLSRQIPAITLLGLFFVACAPEEVCITDNTTLIEVGFYKELFAGTDSAMMEQDTLIVNRITALGTDSIFVTSVSLSEVSLPVNTGSNETTYIFELPSGDQTLQFSYQVFTRFVSEECGLEVIIDSLQVGQTSFDSVVVTQRLLNTDIENNVEVYR
jgi:hypothetical protein